MFVLQQYLTYFSGSVTVKLQTSSWIWGKKCKKVAMPGTKPIDLNISFRGKCWNTDLCIADVLCLQINVKNPCHPSTKTEHIEIFTYNIADI